MTQSDPNAAQKLLGMINGFQVSQALHVAATLKLADLVGDIPREAASIAAEVGTHPRATYRLLRALASVGVFAEDVDGNFTANDLSDLLRSNREPSLRGWAAWVGQGNYWQYWGDLLGAVTTGEDGARRTYGKTTWEVRAETPAENALFNPAMRSLSGASIAAIVGGYDFGQFARIVDIGGGDGTLMLAILQRYDQPAGVVYDLPHVVTAAEATIAATGVGARCSVAEGSFFEPSIPAGADAYVLKSVLHDWDDDESRAILRNIRAAMPASARVLIIEGVVTTPGGLPGDTFSDLNMLVANGGQERTRDEWTALLESARFTLTDVVSTHSRFFILEARPA